MLCLLNPPSCFCTTRPLPQGTFLLRLSAVRPLEARQIIALSRQYVTTEPEAFAMWSGLVQQLKLSMEQRTQVLHCHREYLQDMAYIRQQGTLSAGGLLSRLPQVRAGRNAAGALHCGLRTSCPGLWECPNSHHTCL
jgi:hypothetical protein